MRVTLENNRALKQRNIQKNLGENKAIEIIANDGILFDFKHPKVEQYPNQRIMVISIENYPYCIPYIMNDKEIVLKTIYPDRKFKKLLESKNGN